jgi:hypothetical protein
VANARAFFAIFGAGIVSFTGTAAALIHYWPKHSSSKLAWALRAYIARLRRKVVRIEKVKVPVERIVEKIVAEVETPVLIEKTIVRFISIPAKVRFPVTKPPSSGWKGTPPRRPSLPHAPITPAIYASTRIRNCNMETISSIQETDTSAIDRIEAERAKQRQEVIDAANTATRRAALLKKRGWGRRCSSRCRARSSPAPVRSLAVDEPSYTGRSDNGHARPSRDFRKAC